MATKTKVHSTSAKILIDHDLVNFYFGEKNPKLEKDISTLRDKMAIAEKELLSQNGLSTNCPADMLLKTIEKCERGYHSIEDIFTSVIDDPKLNILNKEIIVNLIKVSLKVLTMLNIYSHHGFLACDGHNVYIRKASTRPENKNWSLIGLNREVFF